MNTTTLECFVALAEEQHFSRAAHRVGVSQSAFSERIRSLENEVGVPLATRDSRSVTLTQAGTIFLRHAKSILDELATALRSTRLAGEGRAGELRVGSVPSALNVFVPLLIRRLAQLAPDLTVHVEEEGSTAQVARLGRGTLDLAIVRGRESAAPDVVLELLYSEPLAAFVSREHSLATRASVDREMLAHEPLIMWTRSGGFVLYDEIIRVVASVGSRSQIIEAPNTTSERAFAAAGLGVLVRPWSWPTHDENIVRVPIVDTLRSELYLGYRTPLESPSIRRAVELARFEARALATISEP